MTEQYQQAYDILKKSQISSEESDITKNLFFMSDDKNSNITDIMCESKLTDKQINFLDLVKIPIHLKNMYKILGDGSREVTYQYFSFFSLNNIIKRMETYEKDKQNSFIDLGLCYHGMGWVIVLTLDKTNGNLFLRLDGGSNGYDREFNYNKFIKLKTEVIPKKFLINFDQFLDILKNGNILDNIYKFND